MSRKVIAANAGWLLLAAAASLPQANGQTIRHPLGVYAHVDVDGALTMKFGHTNPGPIAEHAYLQGLYESLLKNDNAVSGIALGVHWDALEPYSPYCAIDGGCPPPTQDADGYDWSWLDDVFLEANTYGRSVQLILTPGVDSPPWLYPLLGPTCDSLFPLKTPPKQLPSCGFVKFSAFPEMQHADRHLMPLPWSGTYQSYWRWFLTSVQNRYGSNTAFVSVAIAGPICASTEMILPTDVNMSTQASGTPADEAWTALIANSFPKSSYDYQHSDQVFIAQWKTAIDAYEEVFARTTTFPGLTLILSPDSGDNMPQYYDNYFPPNPAWPYVEDCSHAQYPMSCEAKTEVIAYFLKTEASDRKATQVGGMRAGSPLATGNIDVPGVKLLTSLTTQKPPMLGGAEFDYSVSDAMSRQQEGCPSWPGSSCAGLPFVGFTTEEAAYNVLKVFFNQTKYAEYYGGTEGEAPIQWVDLDYTDILYAQTHPATVPSTVPCSPSLQDLLKRASWNLFTIASQKPPVPAPHECK
jgi:hypothetical protein